MPNFTNSERAAFNEDLDRYMAKEVESEKRYDWVEERKNDLLAGVYNPFLPENVQEAIAEMVTHQAIMLGSYIQSAENLPNNNSAQVNASEYIRKVIKEYWEDLAQKVAEDDYDRRDAL